MTDVLLPTPPPADDDSALAAEYVLGVLDLSERAAVEARLRKDTGLAAEVEGWEAHFGALNDGFPEVPAPDLLPRIEARLFPVAAPRRSGWFGWFVGGLTAAALALAVVLALPWLSPQSRMQADLSAEGSDLIYRVSYTGDRLTVARLSGPPAPEGQVHELWLIAGNAAPVSLGTLEAEGETLEMPAPAPGVTLAVSLEPAGGSPTGQPTGPVLVTGVVVSES